MWPVFSSAATAIALLVIFAVVLFAARVVQPAWWRTRAVRIAVFIAFGAMVAGLAVWRVGSATDTVWLERFGCTVAYVGVLVLGPAAAAAPLGAGLDRTLAWATGAGASREVDAAGAPPDADAAGAPREVAASRARLSRRGLIRAGGASLPALGAVVGASGLTTARERPRMPVIRMPFEGLHPDLHGFRILHLSDVHLGAALSLGDLERGLAAALEAGRPDLIVLTGDLADDPEQIPAAMELVTRAAARYGAFASLGNHEYLHGIHHTRPKYEASAVPLLVSSGRTIDVGRARLFVGGADDPVHMGGDIAAMLRPSIERAARLAPAGADLRLLLCHRPEGHVPAAESGFDLVLAGHTHGGQLGLLGRSLLEKLRPGVGWWGSYERARPRTAAALRSRVSASPTRLYTTSGFGHWFPFRVGCPTEMPLVVLERAPERDANA